MRTAAREAASHIALTDCSKVAGREEKRVRSSENMYMCIEGKRERRYIYFKNVLYMVQKNTEAKF